MWRGSFLHPHPVSLRSTTLPVKGREADAKRLFGFSILYLFCLFAALLGEHLAGVRPLGLWR